ncbi:MAG: anti-sigma factor [Gemmatimonadetes bacterium]|jgi:anti-sigma factor RsiW|nr:anti-sigma factor [Gemmatimonadota bacterium]
MNCAQTRELLSGYIDGELPPDQAMELSEHLTTCAECAGIYEELLATVRTLREGLVKYRAPDLLRARVRSALREEERPVVARPTPRVRRGLRVPWRSLAAAAILVVASSGITFVATRDRPSAESSIGEEVLTSHIRSLMPAHLTDVASNDQHNVKPWFNGRLDFSPSVPRLEDAGFPLLGGRLDYVRGRPVAVVVYGRRQHVINVFTWPTDASGDAARTLTTSHGYNLLHWRSGGVERWVVSDLNAAELRQFGMLLER